MSANSIMYTDDQISYDGNPENPFRPVSTQQILEDLAESRRQIAEGKYRRLEAVLEEIGSDYGLI